MSDYSCVLCAAVSKQTSAEPIEFIYCAECGMTTTHRLDVVPPIQPTLEERIERLERTISWVSNALMGREIMCSISGASGLDLGPPSEREKPSPEKERRAEHEVQSVGMGLAPEPEPEPEECQHEQTEEQGFSGFMTVQMCSDCYHRRIYNGLTKAWSDWA